MTGQDVECQTAEWTPSDQSYRLPDHWIDHLRDPESPFAKLHHYYVNRAIDLIVESGAKTVLEVGCGDGWAAGRMVDRGLTVVGTDWSVNAIAHASMQVPGARFHCGDLRDDAFRRQFPDRFDAVALIEVIEHIRPDDAVEALRNITGPLKDGGTLVLTTPHINLPIREKQHYRHFTDAMLRDILAEAGLTMVAVEGYGDVAADAAYWRRMRWFDNRHYTIKPLANRLRRSHGHHGPTPLDRAHGLIVTARKA